MASRTPRCSDLPTRGQGFLVCPFRWVLNVREDKTRKGKWGPDVHFMTRLLSAVSIERFLDYVREISVVQQAILFCTCHGRTCFHVAPARAVRPQ